MLRLPVVFTAAVGLACVGCTDDARDPEAGDDIPAAVGVRKLDVQIELTTDGAIVTLRNEPAQVIFDSMVHAATFAVDHSGATMVVSGSAVTCRSGAPAATWCTVHAHHAGETATGWFFYDFGQLTAPRAIASALALMPGALTSPSDTSDEFQVGRVRCTSVDQPSADAPDFCDVIATR